MTAPQRLPLPDGGPGWKEHYPPVDAAAPQTRQVPVAGAGNPAVYATGTVRLPIVVKCAVDGCPSAIAMPPGTPPNVQTIRLEAAEWSRDEEGWTCPFPKDHSPAPAPTRPAPRWARMLLLVGIYLLLLTAMVLPVIRWDRGVSVPAVVNAVLVTVVWWGFVALRYGRRR